MAMVNLVISEKAKKNFDRVKEQMNMNQHDAATFIFENMDIKALRNIWYDTIGQALKP